MVEFSDLVEKLARLELNRSSTGNLNLLNAERTVANRLWVLEVEATENG